MAQDTEETVEVGKGEGVYHYYTEGEIEEKAANGEEEIIVQGVNWDHYHNVAHDNEDRSDGGVGLGVAITVPQSPPPLPETVMDRFNGRTERRSLSLSLDVLRSLATFLLYSI